MNPLSYGLVGCLLIVGMVHAEDSRPNILLITSEDNGPELGCYGDPYAKTPHLDALAREGIRFDRAFVTQAGCSQSRASILTGLYPHQNGQIGLATWKFRMYRADTPNMVRSLKDVGYRTGIIGKLHVNPASAFPFDSKAFPSANFARKNLAGYAEQASRFFHASDQPFFLMINYPDAHRPFLRQVNSLPAQPLTGNDVEPLSYFGVDHPELRKQTADYYNCLTRLDALIGDLLTGLRASGKAGNTLIIYLGDHGADMLRGKRTSYEGGVRVPMIVSWPGKLAAGEVRRELVSTVDLLPTVLEAAQIQPLSELPGVSLLSLLREAQPSWRQHLFTEYHLHSAHNFYPQRTVRDDRYKLIQNLMPGKVNPGYAYTMKRFFPDLMDSISQAAEGVRAAYERMRRPPEFELYDLRRDPHEFRDLAQEDDHQVILQKLQRELARWRRETADPLLDPYKLKRLKAEIDASFVDGVPQKGKLELNYPDYFFESAPTAELSGNAQAGRHNVLFIAVDDLRPTLGCYGDPIAVTPNIDSLAARGTLFARAYCQQAVCSPSRLSLMTGRRPDTIRVWDLKTHFRATLPDLITLPQLFPENGYHTRSIGKIYHGSGAPSKDMPSWSEEAVYDYVRDPQLRYSAPENLTGRGLKRGSMEAIEVSDRDSYVEWREWKSGRVEARELYDHRADPQEMRNIASLAGQSEVLQQLAMTLHHGWQAALPGETLP